MPDTPEPRAAPGQAAASQLTSAQLLAETAKQASALVRSEVALAKAELKDDLRSELDAAKGLGVAVFCALRVLDLVIVAAVFGLAYVMPGWGAALLVAALLGALAAVTGIYGWKHLRAPLTRTRKSVEEDIRWAKQQIP